ncbi:MAG TPA: class II aldolase/adducin family protein [candidate division Zixibacteria bacterium]|nr:class II aldolase/adducin family protein [candidate division Zixibacteria bacterium]
MNSETQAIADLIKAGDRLRASGLLPGTSGNLSARCDGGFVITNSGATTGHLSPEDFSFVGRDGNVTKSSKPSSELPLHQAIYRIRDNARAIVHVHAPFVVALTLAETCFDSSALPETKLKFGEVPTTRFAQPSTGQSAEVISEVLTETTKAVIIPLHGLVAIDENVREACSIAEEIEYSAKVQFFARLMQKVERINESLYRPEDCKEQQHEGTK